MYYTSMKKHLKNIDDIRKNTIEQNELINVERYLRDLPKLPLVFNFPKPPIYHIFIGK